MKISVVTPSYNQGEFLAETIESVLGQAGDFFLDYLVVDGGSSDDSVAVIRKYQDLLETGKWPVGCRGIELRWSSEPDRGQTDALMKGFAQAKGEILAWLNSDDTYLPGALQAAAQEFRRHPEAALVYGDAVYCDAAGTTVGRYRTLPFDLARLAWVNFICQPAAFFRREAFEAAGGLDRSLRFAMDFDLWVRLGKTYPCRHLPGLLATYRLHESSKTVADATLFENSEEALRLALSHFGWAPVNRVYTSCSAWLRARLPLLARCRPALVVATVLCSVVRSLWLNKGVDRRDVKLINGANFRKLSKSRSELMTGSDGNP